MTTTLIQPATVLGLIYAGILLGFAYDLLRIFRRAFCKRAVDLVCDILFVFIACAAMPLSFLAITNGDVRLYGLIAYGFGFLWEQKSVGYSLFHVWYTVKDHLQKKT